MMNGTPVWQIDGNFGLTSGVAEMLVQSQSGYTQFLPAIPSAWEEGSVQGLKARGNLQLEKSGQTAWRRHLRYAMTETKKAVHLQDLMRISLLQKYMLMEKKLK